MSQWPIIKGPSYGEGLSAVTTSSHVAVTANGTANVKGTTWTTLDASTADQYQALIVNLKGASAALLRSIVDIGVGAAGSEQILVPDLRVAQGTTVGRTAMPSYYIPVGVASGVRLSARIASSTASSITHIQVIGIPQGMQFDPSFYQVDHYGINTADSGATQIDAGATINTKGTYGVLSASTTNPIKMFYVLVNAASTSTPAAAGNMVIDVSIGAASSEQVICPDLQWSWGVDGSMVYARIGVFGPFYADIPAATRLAARCSSSNADATGRTVDVSVLAFH